jgi:hypothetical protein
MSIRYKPAIAMMAFASLVAGCGGGGGGDGGSSSNGTPPMSSNAAPTISGLVASQTVAQDEQSEQLAFSIGDAESPASDITLTVTSSSAVIAQDGVQISGNGANRTLTVSPVEGASGNATVTVTATDPAGAFSTATVNVTVSSAQRSFTEMVDTAYAKSDDGEAEAVTGYSWVDDASEDPDAFNHLLQ